MTCLWYRNQDRISRPVPLSSEYETSTLRRWSCCTKVEPRRKKQRYVFCFLRDRRYICTWMRPRPQEREWLRWLWRDLDLHTSRRTSVLPKERAGPNGKPPGTVELIRTTEPFRTVSSRSTVGQKRALHLELRLSEEI